MEFFNYQNSSFSASSVINSIDKKNKINALIASISHDGRIVYIFDFTGLPTRRIVCVYSNHYWRLSASTILEFIVLIKAEQSIPQCETYKDRKNANRSFAWVNWDRLNVGELKIYELKERLLELSVVGYKTTETKKG